MDNQVCVNFFEVSMSNSLDTSVMQHAWRLVGVCLER